MDQPVRFHGRRKEEAYTERPELNGDNGGGLRAAAGAADNRKRKFSARQETRLAAADRDQIGFRQNLQEVVPLQQAHGCADVQVWPEREQVQQVRDRDLLVAQHRLTVWALREL